MSSNEFAIKSTTVSNAAGASAVNIQDGGNTITVDGTVDTELPAAAALADGASATPTTPTVGSVPLLMNATTVDRARAIVNGINSTGTGIAAAGLVGQLDDAATSAVTENQFAPVRISTRRALLIEGVASGTAVTVDTELPAAAALADAKANPTTSLIGSCNEVYNGTTWDRAREIVNATNTTGTGIPATGILAQFDDVAPTSITENQFGNLRMSANRNFYVTLRDAAGNERGLNVDASGNISIASITTSIVPGTGATNLGKAEDSVAASGDTGVGALFVINNTNASKAADGDYTFASVDDSGMVRTVGNVANDAVDAGDPIKIGGKAQTDGTTSPSAVSATNDRVNAFFDTKGFQHVKDHSQEDSGTTLTAINTTYNNVTTTASSADVTCTGYRWVDFFFTLDSTLAPTDITFKVQAKDGANYFDYGEGYWGKFIFDDLSCATAISKWVRFPAPASGTFRINVTATGTDATNYFDVTNAKVYLRT